MSGIINVERDVVSVESGKGLLFVSGAKIESFFIEFVASSDTNPSLLDLSSGTYIGDMTRLGVLAAAFDNDNDQFSSVTVTGAQYATSVVAGVGLVSPHAITYPFI